MKRGLLTVLLLLGLPAVGCGGESETVTVPYVVGLKVPIALASVREAGLEAHIDRRPSPSIERGFVVAQSPASGAKVDKGASLEVVVSAAAP